MLPYGQYHTLSISKFTPQGAYLADDEGNEVLLPGRYVPEEVEVGEDLKVFLYKDSEDRPIATTLTPAVTLHQFAPLQVSSVGPHGAFFDWGLAKELLVPYAQQAEKVQEGKTYVVYLYLDERTERLVGTTKVERILKKALPEKDTGAVNYAPGQEVDVLVYAQTPIGYSVIINQQSVGLLYKNEVFEPLPIGTQKKAFIKQVRPDGKIDLSLQQAGYGSVDKSVQKLRTALEENGGSLPLNDKSDPQLIYDQLGMSKKVFKKAVGALYKQRAIQINDGGISLVP